MSLEFETKADKANNLLITRVTGFCSSLTDYQAWEEQFSQTWQANFGQKKIKVLADQRGFKPTFPEFIQRVVELREQTRDGVISIATVVDDPIAALQMKRMSTESEFDDLEKFFDDLDEALE